MGDARQRQEGMRTACCHQGLRETQAVGDGDVVVGKAVDEHQWACELRRVLNDAVAVIHVRVEAQITLGVVRVVQRPVGGRGTGAGGLEHVGCVQHGQRGEESSVGPADHAHLIEVGHRNCLPLAGGGARRRWTVLSLG